MSKDPIVGHLASVAAAAFSSISVGKMQMRYAVQHLMGAASFSRRVGEMERAHAGERLGSFFDDILHSATASVFLAVASLEASANELFEDRVTAFAGHPEALLSTIWVEFEKKPVLDKFDLALTLKGAPKLDRGAAPAQAIDALVRLRNALVHFKPEDFGENGQHAALSKRLHESHRSPFLKGDQSLSPCVGVPRLYALGCRRGDRVRLTGLRAPRCHAALRKASPPAGRLALVAARRRRRGYARYWLTGGRPNSSHETMARRS